MLQYADSSRWSGRGYGLARQVRSRGEIGQYLWILLYVESLYFLSIDGVRV